MDAFENSFAEFLNAIAEKVPFVPAEVSEISSGSSSASSKLPATRQIDPDAEDKEALASIESLAEAFGLMDEEVSGLSSGSAPASMELPAGEEEATAVFVSGVSDRDMATWAGRYVCIGAHHGKQLYQRAILEDSAPYLYYWEYEGGPVGQGWRFGTDIGTDQVWCVNRESDEVHPPVNHRCKMQSDQADQFMEVKLSYV